MFSPRVFLTVTSIIGQSYLWSLLFSFFGLQVPMLVLLPLAILVCYLAYMFYYL